jgi:hypothetical protein
MAIGSAQAEVRESVSGPVRMNTGEGFTPVLGEIELGAGDREHHIGRFNPSDAMLRRSHPTSMRTMSLAAGAYPA